MDEHTKKEGQFRIEARAETQEVTLERFSSWVTIFGVPIRSNPTMLFDAMREIYALGWEIWPPTIAVTEIVLTTQPAPGSHPPQSVSSSVGVAGFGFRPAVPVRLKWNNAWGFPGTSISLPDAVPNQHGRFSLVLQHTTVSRAGKDWVWEQQNQLVLVAQQFRADGSIEFSADYRPVPPHVLWKWVP